MQRETALQEGPRGYPATVRRTHPRLLWRDERGPQTATIAGRSVLGSAPNVDVTVLAPTVSRLHAEVERRPDGLWVCDLGSRNGTFVNGVRVERACVPERGEIRVGEVVLEVRYGRDTALVDLWPEPRFGPLIGESDCMRELFARLHKVAGTESTVLVRGETGTGKELVARAIHESSSRAGGPFVVVDCGALPDTLLEAELFGHAKGAFTGAGDARPGAFEAAEGGTLCLDEIGELPLAMQPKLLRAVESKTVRRLGETHHRPVDVRFASSTHRDLRAMVNARAFREDLYFRLAVVPIDVPPLRERPGDIALLARHLLPARAHALLAPAVLRDLERRPWLGNVRELRNVLERLAALGPHEALCEAGVQDGAAHGGEDDEWLALPWKDARELWTARGERLYVEALLQRHAHNVTAAAGAAGINRAYLHRLIQRHGL